MLRRTDTLVLVYFLYTSLSRISKAETVKRKDTASDGKPFSVLRWKSHLAYVDRNKILWIPRNRELNWIFFSVFPKRDIFLHFNNISFCSFEGVRYFWIKLCISSSKLPFPTNQQLFCVTERNIRQGPLNYTPLLYDLLLSLMWLTLSFGEVSETCRTTH